MTQFSLFKRFRDLNNIFIVVYDNHFDCVLGFLMSKHLSSSIVRLCQHDINSHKW